MVDDTQLYIKCMEEVRDRVSLVSNIGARRITTGTEVFDVELVFVQLRKILELIVFASLTANKEEYSAAHEKFATHWKAKLMLQELIKINPEFYPMPIGRPQLQPNGVKHCPEVSDPFLTKDDFVLLYDKTGEVLHARNPFTNKGLTVDIKYGVKEWVARTQVLLALHIMHLVVGKKWLVEVP